MPELKILSLNLISLVLLHQGIFLLVANPHTDSVKP